MSKLRLSFRSPTCSRSRSAIESRHEKRRSDSWDKKEGLIMAVTVKKIVLWRKEVENKPGALASTLASLASAGADLQVVMGYRYPGQESKAAIELYPVTAMKSVAAAKEAGLTTSSIQAFLVEGDNRPGLGQRRFISGSIGAAL